MEQERPEWLDWLSQGIAFMFVGKAASCLVRRESKQRGGFYWYAYHRKEGKLIKKYVGKAVDVTLAKSDASSLTLMRRLPGSSTFETVGAIHSYTHRG
jgi:LuxR family maltose regulon positive regulatory protein